MPSHHPRLSDPFWSVVVVVAAAAAADAAAAVIVCQKSSQLLSGLGGVEWNTKALARWRLPPASSPVPGLLLSFLAPGPGGEWIETNPENSAEQSERRPGTETVEICEETVNPHGKVNAEDFNVLKVIGKGGYGTVFLVQRATESSDKGKFYAMKVLKKARLVCNEKNTAHTVSERNILEVLKLSEIIYITDRAPEIIRCAGHGRAVDWWSLGTLLFDMLSGGPPFSQEENKKATAEKILKSQVKFPPSFSPEAISLIRGLLRKDPKERLGAKNDVEEIKQQRFFKRYDINWTDVYDRKMEPPFRPELLSDSDVSMFDPTFTGLQPIVSPGNADESVPGDLFQGFSFVASSIIEPTPRGVLPDLNRTRGPSRGVRGAISMGRLSRMNGITPTLMANPTVGGAHSFGQQNKNRTRPDCAPTASIVTNPAVVPVMLPSIPNRYGGYEADDPLPSHGCDLSDFASNPSAPVVNFPATTVSQASQLPPADRDNPEKNQLIVATSRTAGGGTEENCTVYSAEAPPLSSRMLNTFREADEKEEDEDNIPGAQRIGQQASRRGLMAGESSTASSKIKHLAEAPRDHRLHAPVNGSKTLADTKPFSYPNLLVSPSGLKLQPTRASSKPVMRSVSPAESVESATKRAPHATSPAGQYKSAAQHHHLQPQQPQQLHRVGSGSTASSNPPHAVSGGSNNAKCSVM
ncbi:Ribosomal protein S6 kinase beta-2 [Sparganum proliferum]